MGEAKEKGLPSEVMKLRVYIILRALRLCNPLVLQLTSRGSLCGPPSTKEAFPVFCFLIDEYPYLTGTALFVSFLMQRLCKVTLFLINPQTGGTFFCFFIFEEVSKGRTKTNLRQVLESKEQTVDCCPHFGVMYGRF